jgi:signal transduction histidine kinase
LLSARAGKQRVDLQTELPEQPVFIEADSGQIRQVLLNLLLNALDALPGGGTAYVQLASSDGGSLDDETGLPEVGHAVLESVELGGEDSGRDASGLERWVAIRVGDSGPGLPAELGERIFEPFVSTKETGTGLGLSICQRIVTAHGGEMSAANRPEGGAEFTIRLPLPAAIGAAERRRVLSS